MEKLLEIWQQSGISQMSWGEGTMIAVGLVLLYLAIRKGFEPLLLVPIGFGTLLVNIPGASFDTAPIYNALGQMEQPGGLMYYIYQLCR